MTFEPETRQCARRAVKVRPECHGCTLANNRGPGYFKPDTREVAQTRTTSYTECLSRRSEGAA